MSLKLYSQVTIVPLNESWKKRQLNRKADITYKDKKLGIWARSSVISDVYFY